MAGAKCKWCGEYVRWSDAQQALVNGRLDPHCPRSPSKAHST